jgi:hypothetical protein
LIRFTPRILPGRRASDKRYARTPKIRLVPFRLLLARLAQILGGYAKPSPGVRHPQLASFDPPLRHATDATAVHPRLGKQVPTPTTRGWQQTVPIGVD